MKIICRGKPEANYITEGKVYDVFHTGEWLLKILDDQDKAIIVGGFHFGLHKEQYHLGPNAQWEIVE